MMLTMTHKSWVTQKYMKWIWSHWTLDTVTKFYLPLGKKCRIYAFRFTGPQGPLLFHSKSYVSEMAQGLIQFCNKCTGLYAGIHESIACSGTIFVWFGNWFSTCPSGHVRLWTHLQLKFILGPKPCFTIDRNKHQLHLGERISWYY